MDESLKNSCRSWVQKFGLQFCKSNLLAVEKKIEKKPLYGLKVLTRLTYIYITCAVCAVS